MSIKFHSIFSRILPFVVGPVYFVLFVYFAVMLDANPCVIDPTSSATPLSILYLELFVISFVNTTVSPFATLSTNLSPDFGLYSFPYFWALPFSSIFVCPKTDNPLVTFAYPFLLTHIYSTRLKKPNKKSDPRKSGQIF